MTERLVVIGGDAAGMSAASAARRERGPDELEIVAFDRGNYTSYSACGIPHLIGTDVDDVEALIARTPEQFLRDHAIQARLRHEVTAIDTDRRRSWCATMMATARGGGLRPADDRDRRGPDPPAAARRRRAGDLRGADPGRRTGGMGRPGAGPTAAGSRRRRRLHRSGARRGVLRLGHRRHRH